MGIPNLDLWQFLRDRLGVQTLIETGSGRGESAEKASHIFKNVYTVELSPQLFKVTKKRVGNTVICRKGRSVEFLRELLPTIEGSVTYWLDAHWSESITAGEGEPVPLLTELDLINSRSGNDDFIMVDDAHLFLAPPVWLKPPHDPDLYPDLSSIFDRFYQKDRYVVALQSWRCSKHGVPHGIVFPEDMFVAVPVYAREELRNWMRAFVPEC